MNSGEMIMIEFDIWFNASNISNEIKRLLIQEFNTTQIIWNKVFEQGNNINTYYSRVFKSLKEGYNKKYIEDVLYKINYNNIKAVTINDEDYPNSLRVYDDSPYMLYYAGNIKALNNGLSVAIVGSRNSTQYGLSVSKLISKELTLNGIKVISGMAKGIDTSAHKSCLDYKGFTCAVLGSGIDVIYPKVNEKLFHDITENGCVISQFNPGTPPFRYNFPLRNRIISALSNLIIIVEAGIKSGALITAKSALDQGKDVIVVPGSILNEYSNGSNKLMRDGAYVFTDMDDVYALLNLDIINRNIPIEKPQIKLLLNATENKILSFLSDNPLHIDEILKLSNIDIKQLYDVLFELQLKDKVICISGNFYMLNIS